MYTFSNVKNIENRKKRFFLKTKRYLKLTRSKVMRVLIGRDKFGCGEEQNLARQTDESDTPSCFGELVPARRQRYRNRPHRR